MTPRPSAEGVSRETVGLALSDEQRELLGHYWQILATAGTERGLLGPREVDRLWSRHILNCAVVATDPAGLLPRDSSVIDVGSGAGLPGLVWAIVRPDLKIRLVDSLLRRTQFLREFVGVLGLSERVEVTRGRAEELEGSVVADVTTARAVAPLDRLLPWLAPLTRQGGVTLAMKGESASAELKSCGKLASRLGYSGGRVMTVGDGIVNPPTRVVRLNKVTA